MLKYLRHVHKTKGILLAVHRLFDIYRRFAFGRRRFLRLLEEFDKVFIRNNIKGTFFISAVLLKRHAGLIEKLKNQGHLLGVHGHYHVRMDLYHRLSQEKMVKAGAEAFKAGNLDPSGFRPPYLNYNQDTLDALKSAGYSWTSCRYLLNDLPGPGNGSAVKLNELYHIRLLAEQVSLPREEDGIIDVPVTGPDDELMIDRYQITDPEVMLETWLKTWRACHKNGELYHLMFHPERFLLLSGQVEKLLREIRKKGDAVWVTNLSAIAEWWRLRSEVEIELSREGDSPVAFFRSFPERGTVLLCNPGETRQQDQSFIADSLVLDPVLENEKGKGYIAGKGGRIHALGLPDSCPDGLEEFLKREGFLTARNVDPDSCSLYLDLQGPFTEADERALLEQIHACENPLIRLWRWPERYESAVTFSADICAIDFWDFVARGWHFHNSGK